ncbi:DUF4397 domain-containing protein [Mucilaginibacter paludis]|nr:DUF4397 domain-containing protein [Mucilaginibacter paludis]
MTIMLCYCLLSCKKDFQATVPGDGRGSYINFYNASEALIQSGNGTTFLTQENRVYINDSISRSPFFQYPVFSTAYSDREFPLNANGSNSFQISDEITVPSDANYSLVYWLPILSGRYKFIFTSGNKVYLKDTTVSLEPKTFAAQYLVEGPESDMAYRIVTTPVKEEQEKGKTTLQVVNLSPDVGKIDVWRAGENGKRITTDLPGALAFGEYYTSHADTTGASATNGRLYLNVSPSGSNQVLLTVAVPAVSESSFIVQVQGFIRQANRRIKSSNTDYATISIKPNFRIKLRRLY